MSLFALDPGWNDFYTIAGFFVGVVGFAYTIYQVLKTKSAALAAEAASEKMLQESRLGFQRFVAALAYRYLAEARGCVESESWASPHCGATTRRTC